MLEKLRFEIARRHALREVSRLDDHLRRDIGFPARDEAGAPRRRVLLRPQGPFERYNA